LIFKLTKQIILVVCILFVLYDLVQGRYSALPGIIIAIIIVPEEYLAYKNRENKKK
jgi:hypothetical protein